MNYVIDILIYIEKINANKLYAGDLELNNNKYTFIKYYENENNNKPNYLLILSCNEIINHYELLYHKDCNLIEQNFIHINNYQIHKM